MGRPASAILQTFQQGRLQGYCGVRGDWGGGKRGANHPKRNWGCRPLLLESHLEQEVRWGKGG